MRTQTVPVDTLPRTRHCPPVAAAVCAAVGLCAPLALALPSLTAHPNGAGDITWPNPLPVGFNANTDMHQHWNTDPLPGVAGKFKTYAAWDDNNWRYNTVADQSQLKANGDAADYGHGYMANPAQYAFRSNAGLGDAAFPAAAAADFVTGVSTWMNTVNQNGMLNTNGKPTSTSINFAITGVDMNPDIIVRFSNNFPTGANYPGNGGVPGTGYFPSPGEIEPNGTWPGNPQGAGTSDGVLAYWTPSLKVLTFNANIPWYYSTGNPIVDNNPANGANQWDFLSVVLHEFGHVIGLDHPDNPVLNTTMYPSFPQRAGLGGQLGILRDLDGNTVDGARDLYTIPIPAPETMMILGLGGLLAARRRRRS